jgi:hypothetical protein
MITKIYIQSGGLDSKSPIGFVVLGATSGVLSTKVGNETTLLDFKYKIGQWVPDEGGVICERWIENSRQHYLVVDTDNLAVGTRWSGTTSVIGVSAQSLFNGLSNSVAITQQVGHTQSAAQLCLDSSRNGKTDWYLPSSQEFETMTNNLFHVSQGIEDAGGVSFDLRARPYYWTSTEFDTRALIYRVDNSLGTVATKTVSTLSSLAISVRAIRKFII